MFRIGIAGFIHETNTFSEISTPLEAFIQQSGFYPELRKGEEILKFREGRFNIAASGFLFAADKLDMESVPLVWCGTEPSQPLSQETFDTLMGMILESLQQNRPYDGLFLDLHGAMVFGDLQDGETEILRRIRGVVGEIPIVVSFDLHGNIDPSCFELATAMIGYRTYPHVDGFENGERCAQVMDHILRDGQIHGAFRQLPFLMPSTTQATTKNPAKSMYEFLAAGDNLEDVLTATIMEGFPPCDLPHTGPSIFAYGRTQEAAEQAVARLYGYILDREGQFICDLVPWEEAAKQAVQLSKTASGPIILADIQDNAGGGSPSDSTWLLEALVKHGARKTALGLIHDPDAVAAAFAAGEGAELILDVGGKSLEGHHPFRARYQVVKLHEGDFLGSGPMVKDRVLNLGKMAQLLVDDVRVVVASERMQALDQSLFRVVGIEPADMKILALKSANHYRADFGPIASQIINVESPSAIIEDPSKIPYTRLREGVRLKGLGPVYHRPGVSDP